MFKLSRYTIVLGLALGLSSCGSLQKTSRGNSEKSDPPKFEHELLKNSKKRETKSSAQSEKSAASTSSSEYQDDLQAFIDDWYGTPHRMGGMTKHGVDCSGFVIIAYQEVFKRAFKGRRAEEIFGEMKALDQEELEYGDLVFFKVRGRRIDHVGIYIGQGQFAHASSSKGVMISLLSNSYWSKRFFKGGRYKS